MEAKIGINQRIPLDTLEDALLTVMTTGYDEAHMQALASAAFEGPRRARKALQTLHRLVKTNALLPAVLQCAPAVQAAMKCPDDRNVILVALVNAGFSFCFDVTSLLGKYFHAQPHVTTQLIVRKMAEKYGSNKALTNALYLILPMLVEAGFVVRERVGVYRMGRQHPATAVARQLYRLSFLLNNPLVDPQGQVENHFYFEFLAR